MPLPSSLALTTIADGSSIVAGDHRNNYTAIQTNTNQTLGVLGAAWTAYVPVWTCQTLNPVLGNGSLTGRYLQVGKMVTAQIKMVGGGTTTFGTGQFFFSLPVVAAVLSTNCAGSGWVLDTSAGALTTASVNLLDQTHMNLFITGVGSGNLITSANPFTWATGDEYHASFCYEAA